LNGGVRRSLTTVATLIVARDGSKRIISITVRAGLRIAIDTTPLITGQTARRFKNHIRTVSTLRIKPDGQAGIVRASRLLSPHFNSGEEHQDASQGGQGKNKELSLAITQHPHDQPPLLRKHTATAELGAEHVEQINVGNIPRNGQPFFASRKSSHPRQGQTLPSRH
jgi:hypothetical protein